MMRLKKELHRVFWSVLILFPLLLPAQENIAKAGEIRTAPLDSLFTMTYYLPSQYDRSESWPVIFVFDPSGRGDVAVDRFRSAAEKYGYIIAASDGIKNGSYQRNYHRARSLFDKANAEFHLDSINQFTAGFSGGARLASAIAGLSKNIRGVLAAGAGVNSRYLTVDQIEPFVFIGMAGDKDFNFAEVKSSEVLLRSIKYPHEMIWFEGGHDWPPYEVVEKAVRDLSVKMHSRGQQKRSKEELNSMYKEEMAYSRKLQDEGNMVWAYENLEKMRSWYGFLDKDRALKDEMKEVKRMKGFRSQRSDLDYIDEIEQLYLQEYLKFLLDDIGVGELEALGYWDQELKHIEKSFVNHKEEAYRNMAFRIIAMLRLVGTKANEELQEPEHFKQLLFTNIFLTLTDKRDYDAYLESVRFAVALGEYEIALYYTDKLLENEFKDIERLRNYPGITLLRIQPEFGEVLEKYGFDPRF